MTNYLDIEDNIVALATANGVGSIDVIRISGNNLIDLYAKITKDNQIPTPNMITKKKIYSFIDDSIIDTCMISFFQSPLSFTGQDIIEINCHGGGYIAHRIIEFLCSSNEIRKALPGEFLFRAYTNKKIDIIQAESINEMITSESITHNNKTLENIDGKLSEEIKNIKKKLTNLLLVVEHELDFDESEILHIQDEKIAQKIKEIIKKIESITKCYFFSKTVRSGLRVLILGKPNVGKSSIFNALLGINRSIVANMPGTTRDVIESTLEIDGHKVVLIDSAGSWESVDKIESMGIEKTKNEIKNSNIVILVGENKKDITPFKNAIKDKEVITVYSKSDINDYSPEKLSISIKNNVGLSRLSTEISTKIKGYYLNNKINNEFLINSRQRGVLETCNKKMKSLLNEIENGVNRDILADLLHDILDEYNNVINPIDREDVINQIFMGFCVGK
tara:strand:+ start:38963 stop:40306 length:1344 start_codon:yes stop_codon:yes gene_type:complete